MKRERPAKLAPRQSSQGQPGRRPGLPGLGPVSEPADLRPSSPGGASSAEDLPASQPNLPGGGRSREVPGTFSAEVDRTDKKSIKELLDTKRRFSLALRAAGAGAWEWDIESNRALWSEENYAVLGLPVGDGRATYEEWLACVHPEDREFATEQVGAAVREKTDLDFEYRAVWPDGTIRWIRDVGRMMLDEDGKAIGMFGIQMDVTEKRLLAEQRERLIRELESRNAELERFAYTLSHELKTPLVTSGGFLPSLRKSAEDGDLERFHSDLGWIQNAQQSMAHLLSDLLELCRLGFLQNPVEEIPFADVVGEAVVASQDKLRAAGVRLDMAAKLPTVRGDKLRLIEMMQALLENAAQFTRREVRPRVDIGVRSDQGEQVVFVRDNGIGIAPPLHEKVFELFRKLNAGDPGSGVGLAIARRIVELHDGRIWVESPGEGQGSTFCISLPWVAPVLDP